MKDHLNIMNARIGGNFNRQSLQLALKEGPSNFRKNKIIKSLDKSTEDLSISDDLSIKGFDFPKAKEYSNWIKEQSLLQEGRLMMGKAHQPITQQQVIQLLGEV